MWKGDYSSALSLLLSFRVGIGKLWLTRQSSLATCIRMACELRKDFAFSSSCWERDGNKKVFYDMKMMWSSHVKFMNTGVLEYHPVHLCLLSGPLWKFADPDSECKTQFSRFSMSLSFRVLFLTFLPSFLPFPPLYVLYALCLWPPCGWLAFFGNKLRILAFCTFTVLVRASCMSCWHCKLSVVQMNEWST